MKKLNVQNVHMKDSKQLVNCLFLWSNLDNKQEKEKKQMNNEAMQKLEKDQIITNKDYLQI